MWTTFQFYAIWLVLVGVVGGTVVKRHHRTLTLRVDAASHEREARRHARWRRRRLRARQIRAVDSGAIPA